jgi:hypothetical protein
MKIKILSGEHDANHTDEIWNLIYERDMLFDKYIESLDKYIKWSKGEVQIKSSYNNRDEKYYQNEMSKLLRKHVDEISVRLRTFDEQITKLKHTDLATQISEVN